MTAPGKDPKGKDESTGNAYEKGIYDQYDTTPNTNGGQGSYRTFFQGKEIYENSSVGFPKAKQKSESKKKR